MTATITTNNVPRLLLSGYELTAKQREQFDYLELTEENDDSYYPRFFIYRGYAYDSHEFERTQQDGELSAWDGYQADTYFSATIVRYAEDSCESVVVGSVYFN